MYPGLRYPGLRFQKCIAVLVTIEKISNNPISLFFQSIFISFPLYLYFFQTINNTVHLVEY